ncbi:MAG: Fe(3+) ABC transporter substrate-binding protein [Bacteroidota bacterium]
MRLASLITLFALFFACGNPSSETTDDTATNKTNAELQTVTLYTHRHYDVDKEIYADFQKETGIEVNVVKAGADELIQKMEVEGDQSPADLLLTVDAGRLVRAHDKGLLQPITSTAVTGTIPAHLRANDNSWVGLTKRARIIVYHPERVDAAKLSTYEALADPEWKGRVLIRSSGNIYNQSLLASIVAHAGEDQAKTWAEGVVANMARAPKGNDRDQVKAILAGEGDLAVVNTYYMGLLRNSDDEQSAKAGNAVKIFFPNQADRGTHVNVSGIGLAKHAPHAAAAVRLIEYLASKPVQERFASTNYEYPTNPTAEISDELKSWGTFKEDELPLTKLGEMNRAAVMTFDVAGWE